MKNTTLYCLISYNIPRDNIDGIDVAKLTIIDF